MTASFTHEQAPVPPPVPHLRHRTTFPVDITGKLIPTLDGAPVLLSFPGRPLRHLPAFRNQPWLSKFMHSNGRWNGTERIDDSRLFLDKLRQRPDVILIVDPWITLDGVIFFQQHAFGV